MKFEEFRESVEVCAALRRRQTLQPAGGQGDKIFPPTYPGENNGPARHVFERRRIGGEERPCVLIDSVQAQANRMEEALLRAAEEERIRLPRLTVDFPGAGLNSVGPISVLQAPHRIFDAILRDSLLDDRPFRESDLGERLKKATPADATAILEAAPTALVFGAWHSTGEDGGLGAKFARVVVSEAIGVDVPVERFRDQRSGEVRTKNAGRRTGSRIDPLGIPRSVQVYRDPGTKAWDTDKEKLGGKAKEVRPSEINHGNIAPSVDDLGVTCDHALLTQVLTFAGLRRLRFGNDAKNLAARTYLAALGLVAMTEADRHGHSFRSRCDLVCDGIAPLERLAFDGSVTNLGVTADEVVALHEAAFDAAHTAGFKLDPKPVILKPQKKLVEIVRESQQKALSDQDSEG
jgi:CRISPR-associated protein Csb1